MIAPSRRPSSMVAIAAAAALLTSACSADPKGKDAVTQMRWWLGWPATTSWPGAPGASSSGC